MALQDVLFLENYKTPGGWSWHSPPTIGDPQVEKLIQDAMKEVNNLLWEAREVIIISRYSRDRKSVWTDCLNDVRPILDRLVVDIEREMGIPMTVEHTVHAKRPSSSVPIKKKPASKAIPAKKPASKAKPTSKSMAAK